MIRAHLYVPEVNADLGRDGQKVIMDKTKQTAVIMQTKNSNYFLISSGDQIYLKCSEFGVVSWSKRSAALDPYLSTDGFLWRYDEARQALLSETGRNLVVNKKTLAVTTDLVSSTIVQILPDDSSSTISSTDLKAAVETTTTTSSPQDAWWLWLILILIVVLLLLLVMFMLVGWGNGYRWMKKP